ncbi:MAG TPA: DUF3159 domain-containing protein [Mycobacteriales bacterium]|nr:DUF3159 domain-containing protein [Mycobacteriales bacterium]
MSEPVDFRGAVLDGIGGWRGMIDSSIPVAVFAIVNIATSVRTAVYAALGAGVGVALVRLARRQSVQQAVSGLFGLAIAALLALRTHKASNFYLPGIIYGGVLAVAGLVSVAARRPVVGYLFGVIDPKYATWRDHPGLLRTFQRLTLLWSGWFAFKTALSLLLYVTNHATGLAGVRLALGYPPLILFVFVTLGAGRRALAREGLILTEAEEPS